jgi:hypothetical protein
VYQRADSRIATVIHDVEALFRFVASRTLGPKCTATVADDTAIGNQKLSFSGGGDAAARTEGREGSGAFINSNSLCEVPAPGKMDFCYLVLDVSSMALTAASDYSADAASYGRIQSYVERGLVAQRPKEVKQPRHIASF